MRILYIGTLHPHPGGSAVSGSQILENLAKQNNEVIAIAPIIASDFARISEINKMISGVRVERYEVPYYNTSTHDTHSEEYSIMEFRSITSLYDSLREVFNPDIIFLGRETFAPLIAHFEGHAPIVLRVAGATTLGIANSTFPVELANKYLIEYACADLLIAPAKHVTKFLNSKGLNHCVHITNAVDMIKFETSNEVSSLRTRLKITQDVIVVSHISGLESIKRPMDFMKAASILVNSRREIIFLVVGKGPCYSEMVSYAKENGFLDQCRFVGWIDYINVHNYFGISDIIVMPCEADTQPRVYLESMASGKVLIASEIPAAAEVIENGLTGLLYEKGNIHDLAKCVAACADNLDETKTIGVAARLYVAKKHSWQKTIAEYQKQFQELIMRYHES